MNCITYCSTLVPYTWYIVLLARGLFRYHSVLLLSDSVETVIGWVNLHHHMMAVEFSVIRGRHLRTIAEDPDEVIRHDGDHILRIRANRFLTLNHEVDCIR